MSDITLLVKTIGRETLTRSIQNGIDEGFTDILVGSDGANIEFAQNYLYKNKDNVNIRYFTLAKKFGCYGAMLWNVGAVLANNDYICNLDDDDVFMPNIKKYMVKMISLYPNVDVWIGGIKHKNGLVLAIDPERGITYANVAYPTYKVNTITRVPFSLGNAESGVDHRHVKECHEKGFKVDWYKKVVVDVRPNLVGLMGEGRLTPEENRWID